MGLRGRLFLDRRHGFHSRDPRLVCLGLGSRLPHDPGRRLDPDWRGRVPLGDEGFTKLGLPPPGRLDKTTFRWLLLGWAFRRQSALVITIIRAGSSNSYRRPDLDLGEEAASKWLGHADTAVGGRAPRPGYGSGMEADAIVGEAEEVGHLGPGKAATFRDAVAAPLGVGDDDLTLGVVNLAVEV
jgi:hypothetical protein